MKRTIGVIGIGRFGTSVIHELKKFKNNYIIAIDENEEKIKEVGDLVDSPIIGDATKENLLVEAGFDRADIVFIGTGDKERNSSTLIVSALAKLEVKKIISKASTDNSEEILSKLGAHLIIRPEKEAGRNAVTKSFFDDEAVVNMINIDEDDYKAATIKLADKHKTLIDKEIQNIDFDKFNVRIIIIKRDNVTIIPRGDTIMRENDDITLIGKTTEIADFLKKQ